MSAFNRPPHIFSYMFPCQGLAYIDESQSVMVPVTDLASNYHDLVATGSLPVWRSKSASITILYLSRPAQGAPEMPNPLRHIAGGEPLYSSFINHFADDVSGNRSKSWNKHDNAYFTHANLPRRLLQQEAHTHFISTSPHATATEQFHHCKKVIE